MAKKARKSAERPIRKRPAKAARRPAVKSRKLPAQVWYGIVVDGKRVPYTLPGVADAEAAAVGLREQGHTVAIYDQETNKVVKRI